MATERVSAPVRRSTGARACQMAAQSRSVAELERFVPLAESRTGDGLALTA